jgi:NAD dependent epimerase/dehydratase family enzyme
MRTGIVLDRGTPAVERLVTITKLGLGGRIGTREQWVSWIHVDDFISALHFLCAQIDGVVNVTSPNPVQNRNMMAALRAALHGRWSLPRAKPLVHIGAMFMRTDPAPPSPVAAASRAA